MARHISSLFAALLMVAPLPHAHGQAVSSLFPPTEIPDEAPGGITLEIAPAPGMLSLNSVTLNIAHEWLGDLTVRLIPPVGPGITLFERVGVTPADPEGSSAILGAFVADDGLFTLVPQSYRFAESGADFAEAAELAVATQNPPVVPTDVVYAAQTWLAGPIPEGTWSIFLSDAAESSTGIINSVELSYTLIPEPGALTLLAVALGASGALLLLNRRRSLVQAA